MESCVSFGTSCEAVVTVQAFNINSREKCPISPHTFCALGTLSLQVLWWDNMICCCSLQLVAHSDSGVAPAAFCLLLCPRGLVSKRAYVLTPVHPVHLQVHQVW